MGLVKKGTCCPEDACSPCSFFSRRHPGGTAAAKGADSFPAAREQTSPAPFPQKPLPRSDTPTAGPN
jgi:hypothetical protein